MRIFVILLCLSSTVALGENSAPWLLDWQQKKDAENEQAPPDPDSRGTDQRPFVIQTKKSEAESETDKHNRKMLEDAAEDAWYIGRWTIGILIVQAIAFFWQGVQLKRSVREMEDATHATLLVAESLQNTSRALVLIDSVEVYGWYETFPEPPGWFIPGVKFKLSNEGASAAFLIECSYAFVHVPKYYVFEEDPIYASINRFDSMPLAVGKPRMQFTSLEAQMIEDDDFASINSGETQLIFYGFVKYKDIFNNDRETRFCMSWLTTEGEPRFIYTGPPQYHRHT